MHGDNLLSLLNTRHVRSLRYLAYKLIEQVNREVAIRLKIFYSFLPSPQSSNLVFNGCNFLDLFFKDFNFALKECIALLLSGDHHLEPPIDRASDGEANQKGSEHRRLKGFLSTLARSFPVRK